MRFLFVSAQLPGHLDWGGFLATAGALHGRGHAVLWASGAAVSGLVAAAGVPFAALAETGWRWPPPPPIARPEGMDDAAWHLLRAGRALDQWLDPPRVAAAVDALGAVAAAFAPDVIVSEVFMAAAGIVAEQRGVPFVVVGWPAVAAGKGPSTGPLVAAARARLDGLLAGAGVRGANFAADGPPALRSPLLHLTFWSDGWYRGLTLLPQTRHAGGLPLDALPADAELPAPDERPWVVITLGTSFNRDPAFFLAAAHAADRLGCLPILLLGRNPDEAERTGWLRQLPTSSVVRETVDLRRVLPYAAAAIHHGGAGTTHALVRAALPQIVVPHAADQIHQAQGLTRTGAGLHIPPKDVTVDRLAAALAALLPDLAPLRAHAAALRAELAALGGIEAAAMMLARLRSVTP